MNVAILMMQKNEDELLDKWIAYHSYLVGHQNLFIYDNGSTSENTLTKLNRARDVGVNIISDYSTKNDYESRGSIFTDKIKTLDDSGKYDFYMLIDCDEFLATVDHEGIITCDRTALSASLANYRDSEDVLMIDGQYYNSSISTQWFNKQPYRKCFFRRGNIASLDQGFHWGKVTTSVNETRTNLVHIHFHNKPYLIAKEHARQKLEGRVDSFDLDYLKNYKGKGFHLVRFFVEGEEQFIASQIRLNHLKSKSLFSKFEELNIAWPYEDEVKNSLKNMGEETENNLFQRVLPSFSGSIDVIELKGETIVLQGWGLLNHSRAINSVYIKTANGRVEAKIVSRVVRQDVNKLLNVAGVTLGFEAHVPLSAFSNTAEQPCYGEVQTVIEFEREFYSFDLRKVFRKFDFSKGFATE